MICHGETTVLVDCGFGLKATLDRLNEWDVCPEDIDSILVTHEHSDHIRGVRMLANKLQVPVKATAGTLQKTNGQLNPGLADPIQAGDSFRVGEITVHSVSVPHDANDPTQFVFESDDGRFGLLTDIGTPIPQVVDHYLGCDALFVESNHDTEMLQYGPYPYSLKARVGGPFGHMSNDEAKEFPQQVKHEGLHTVVIGHISQKNNSMAVLEREYRSLSSEIVVHYASQDDGTNWIQV